MNESRSNLSDAVRLDISEKDIFGRDTETKILQDLLDKVVVTPEKKHDAAEEAENEKNINVPELILVAGPSGVGKSCLVQASLKQKVRAEHSGFFIQGKIDQYDRGNCRGGSVFSDALNDLCDRIDRHEDRDELVGKIKESLGDDLGRLSTFIPGLQRFLSGGESDGSVDGGSNYDRFATLCCTLLQSVASLRPVVLFIDDLQWGDADLFRQLHLLLRSDVATSRNQLLIAGAYRDDEVDEDGALFAALKKIQERNNGCITKLTIGSLSEGVTNEFIAFATDLGVQETAPLSELIYQKTLGNCFFIKQFLEMLQSDRLLFFSFVTYRWEWKLDDMRARTDVSKNVVDLVVSRIDKLDSKSKKIFKIAGCLGSQFTVEVLCRVAKTIILQDDDQNENLMYNCAANQEHEATSKAEAAVEALLDMRIFEKSKGDWIKFSHDNCQQAAACCFQNKQEKVEFRSRIGKILKDPHLTNGNTDQEWLFFTAVDQLNRASSLIATPAERFDLVKMNRLAADKAKIKFAFLPAAVYNETAISLLGESAWEGETFDLTMYLHIATATCYLKCGRSARSYDIAAEVVHHARSDHDRFEGQLLQMETLEHQRRYDESSALGAVMLKSLGEKFPRRPNNVHVIHGFLKTKQLLSKHSDEEWLNLPMMTDKAQLAICDLIQRLFRTLFFAKSKDLLPLLWFRNIEKTFTRGLSSYSAPSLAMFATLLGHMKDTVNASRVANLALALAEKNGDTFDAQLILHLSYYYSVAHWRKPLQLSIDPLMDAYTRGMRVGDVSVAAMCAICSSNTYFCTGLELSYVEKDLRKFIVLFEEYNLQNALDIAIPFHQLILLVTGKDPVDASCIELTGQAMDEHEARGQLMQTGNQYGEYALDCFKVWALALLGQDPVATLKCYQTIVSKKYSKENRGDFNGRKLDFYGALAAMMIFKKSGKRWYLRYARRIAKQTEAFVKEGAINCVHLHLLLQVELTTCAKIKASDINIKRVEIRRAYQVAISSATRSGFSQDAALANEKAAMYHDAFDAEYADHFWREAFDRYVDWGAGQKLDQLEKRHRCLQKKSRQSTAATASTSGRMNARSRYTDDEANEHKSMTFW